MRIATSDKTKRIRTMIWCLYPIFWLFLCGFNVYISTTEYDLDIVDYIIFIGMPFTLAAMCSLIREKRLVTQVFWKCYSIVFFSWQGLYPFITAIDYRGDLDPKYYYLGQFMAFLLYLLGYLALFGYAFRSKYIWVKNT